MRNEKDLDVDVHTHAKRAAARVGSNGNMQDIVHFPRTPNLSWPRRLFKWENLIVAGREVKGWVVPQQLGIALILVIIGAVGTLYWRMNDRIDDQKYMLVEIKTRLEERTNAQEKRDKEIQNSLALQKVYVDSMSNQVYTIKGVLTPEQFKKLERATRKD